MKKGKTNAMRILDKEGIEYNMLTYRTDDGNIDGVSVAQKIGKDGVYKTLVSQGSSKDYYVFVIPVEEELDLKKAAKTAGEKKIEMIPVKEITKVSGYIRGGCSPIGMKKLFPTFIDKKAQDLEAIVISGGSIGLQIEMKLENLIEVINAQIADLIK